MFSLERGALLSTLGMIAFVTTNVVSNLDNAQKKRPTPSSHNNNLHSRIVEEDSVDATRNGL
ncbi:hypothetical protein BH10BAC6_BH10BAC6_16880 [soil metagenome]